MNPDGGVVSHLRNFGDGSPPVSSPNPSHTYSSTRTFTATLTVTDNLGSTGADTASVTMTR